MVTGAVNGALSRKSLTIFASVIALGVMALGVVALGPRDASAASVNINSMRVGPPSMGHPFVNTLGGASMRTPTARAVRAAQDQARLPVR